MTENQDLRERCFYLLTLFKAKNMAVFEKYTAELMRITAEESTAFYHYLLSEYKKLVEGPGFHQPSAPIQKNEATKAPLVRKVSPPKKVAAKKVTKKAKKKPIQKSVKKVSKKTSKKTSKKVKSKKKITKK